MKAPDLSKSLRSPLLRVIAPAALMLSLVSMGGGGLLGCATTPEPVPDPTPPRVEKPAPTESDKLEALSSGYWELLMRRSPTWATYMGDRRYDDRLTDNSEGAIEKHHASLERLLQTLGTLDRSKLSASEQVTADILEFSLSSPLDRRACKDWTWSVDQLGGPQAKLGELSRFHSFREDSKADDAWTLIQRYAAIKVYMENHIAHLKKGLAEGRVAPKINVERVIRQLDELLSRSPEESPFVTQALAQAKKSEMDPTAPVGPDAIAFNGVLLDTTVTSIYPGLAAYKAFLEDELLPKARKDVGVSALPEGEACYAARIKSSIGVAKTADELHELGLAEVARIRGEMEVLVKAQKGRNVDAYLKKLRTNRKLKFKSEKELLDYNTSLVARAQKAMPQAFSRLPETPVEVTPIEAFRNKDAPAAYYYSAPEDGSRPAYYYVNTYEPEKRPRYVMAALAFHEAVPGHHLQISLANENKDLPRFQREVGLTAFVEGWALYAEGLAGELNLYETPDEKLGAMTYEIWRASRLVVDTGMHAKGWSRKQAITYLAKQTGKDSGEVENEIDRYIIWPGQALAYKYGQLEISRMRQEATEALGEGFDLKAFHEEVLRHGAVPLTTLDRLIKAWVVSQKG